MTRHFSRLAVASALVSLLAGAGAVAGSAGAGAAPAAAPSTTAAPTAVRPAAGGWWFCVANDQLDVGYCQGDPIPPIGPIYLP